MNETKKGFIQLHLSVLLAGFTGLFGRLITYKIAGTRITGSVLLIIQS